MFMNMVIHQQRMESKQNLMSRFVDIGTDLFVMAGVCSYALSLAKQKVMEGGASPITLADLFCCEARTRITRHFKDIWNNQDKLANNIAKNIISDK